MIDYASVAQEILETPPRQPDWVRERIAESDELRDQLEAINLREANEREPIERHNRKHPKNPKPIPKTQAPALLRLQVWHLATQLELERKVPYYPIPLLDLVFEIQDVLFELDGARRLREPEEEGSL